MEGRLHRLFKRVVKKELLEEKYTVYFEPTEPPLVRLWWWSYRPDILGIISNQFVVKVVLVECETAPTSKQIVAKMSKIRQSFSLQKQLHEKHVIRLLLIIPPMTLHRINCSDIRRFWEIWIVNRFGEIAHKIPRKINN
jgi:hypothetical protein